MTTKPTEPVPPPASGDNERAAGAGHLVPDVGASNWRSVVLRQAERLSNELDAMPEDVTAQVPSALLDQARTHVAAARAIAEDAPRRWKTLRNWWTGNGVETAWDHLQTARETMLLFAPTATIRPQLPSLLRRLVAVSADPAHDPQVDKLKTILAGAGDLTDDERGTIRAAHEHVRFAEDDHSEARTFRNNLLLWSAILAIGSVILASFDDQGFRYLSSAPSRGCSPRRSPGAA